MTAYNFAELMDKAKAEGFSNELLPEGRYLAEVVNTNAKASQGGKDTIGVRWKVLEALDPSVVGSSDWDNQTISPEDGKAMGMFFRWAYGYGFPEEYFHRQPSPTPAEIADLILGTVAVIDVKHRPWKSRPGDTRPPKVSSDFKLVEIRASRVSAPTAPQVVPGPVAAFAPPVQVAAVTPQDVGIPAVAQPVPAFVPPAGPAPAPVAAVPPLPTAPVDPATGLPAVRTF